MDTANIVQKIQYVLATAIMVSASALLLLGFQNKFSNLASRFRALNHEKRLLSQKTARDEGEEARLTNLSQQVDQLLRRATFVKNAIVLCFIAIGCFTATSVLIFINFYLFSLDHLITVVFLGGLLAILSSSFLMIIEVELFYKVIMLEKKV